MVTDPREIIELSKSAQSLARGRTRPLCQMIRFQVLSTLLVMAMAVSLPLALGFSISGLSWQTLWSAQSLWSFALSVLASIVGLGISRGVGKYPGQGTSVFVLPTVAFAYGLVALIIFFLRMEYSRYVISVSFLTSCAWMVMVFYFLDTQEKLAFAIVPGGKHASLMKIKNVRWSLLESPAAPLMGITGVVADLTSTLQREWELFVAQCTLAGIPVYSIKNVAESLTGKSDVSHLSETTFGSVLPSNTYLRLKRAIDFLVAILILPIFLPIIGAAALLIKLETGGPTIFRQQRIGFRAKQFQIYKLRSMRDGIADGSKFTTLEDPRITRVGKFIRKYRIDEFPQVFNIIKGDMSWIGPRPETVALAEWYAHEIPYYIYRHTVRPGLSGWAQVNQGNVAEIEAASEKLSYDFYYIKHFSPYLDLLIFLRTIHTILTGFGSK